jgi:hypothetical protein
MLAHVVGTEVELSQRASVDRVRTHPIPQYLASKTHCLLARTLRIFNSKGAYRDRL